MDDFNEDRAYLNRIIQENDDLNTRIGRKVQNMDIIDPFAYVNGRRRELVLLPITTA